MYFQVNDGDRFDDLTAGEARFDVRCRAVLGDPIEHVFDGTAVFDPLAESGDRGPRVKGGMHEIAIACASTGDVAVHRPGDRVVLDEISIVGGFNRRETFGVIDTFRAGTFGA